MGCEGRAESSGTVEKGGPDLFSLLVPQLQANLTRWPQLPRKASVLTSHPAGQVPLNHLTGPVCSCRRVACPSWLPWPSSVFYDVAVRAAQGQASEVLVKLVW